MNRKFKLVALLLVKGGTVTSENLNEDFDVCSLKSINFFNNQILIHNFFSLSFAAPNNLTRSNFSKTLFLSHPTQPAVDLHHGFNPNHV